MLFFFLPGMLLLVILLVTVTSLISAQNEGHCVWYGECSFNLNNYLPTNCPYTGPGIVLEDQNAQDLLLNYCPDIYKDRKLFKFFTIHSLSE